LLVEDLAEGVDKGVLLVENLAEGVDKGVLLVEDFAEGVNKSVSLVNYLAEGVDKGVLLVDYLAEGVDKSVLLVENSAEGFDKDVLLVGDLAEGVDKGVLLVGDLAKGVDKSVLLVDDLAEKVDKGGVLVEDLAEKVDKGGVLVDDLAEKVDKGGVLVEDFAEDIDEVGVSVEGLAEGVDKGGVGLARLVKVVASVAFTATISIPVKTPCHEARKTRLLHIPCRRSGVLQGRVLVPGVVVAGHQAPHNLVICYASVVQPGDVHLKVVARPVDVVGHDVDGVQHVRGTLKGLLPGTDVADEGGDGVGDVGLLPELLPALLDHRCLDLRAGAAILYVQIKSVHTILVKRLFEPFAERLGVVHALDVLGHGVQSPAVGNFNQPASRMNSFNTSSDDLLRGLKASQARAVIAKREVDNVDPAASSHRRGWHILEFGGKIIRKILEVP